MSSQPTLHLATRIGRNVLRARLAAGMTQREVGVKLGIDSRGVSRWERGNVAPSPTYLQALAMLFGCDPGWFYVEHDDESVPRTAA